MDLRESTAMAPGKVILSGEHAVVYGKPALVTATNRFAHVHVSPDPSAALAIGSTLGTTAVTHGDELQERVVAIGDRYAAFREGALPIRDVLEHPHDLIAMCWCALAENTIARVVPGIRIAVESELPSGAGMGSSAAVCAATLCALADTFGAPLDPAQCFQLTLRTERYQHGNPSGVDPFVAVYGGCLRYAKDVEATPVPPPTLQMYLVDTGRPEAGTGETVEYVRERFSDKAAVWDRFETITMGIESALADSDIEGVRELMARNHALLREIGVVPERVAEFIRGIERDGGAAKVSGAGSVRGDAGGMVLVSADAPPEARCREHGYNLTILKGESRGVRLCNNG